MDVKEHFADYACNKFKQEGVESMVINLPYASGCDYHIVNEYGSCGIQRKDSMAEICGTPVCKDHDSAMEELKHNILPRLINFTDNPILLVEESHAIGEKGYLFRKEDRVWVETGMHSSSYYGFLESVRSMGINVVCTRNLDASLWFMISMHNYLGKHRYPKPKKSYSDEEIATGMLCCVPTIGEKRARKALAEYSIRDLATIQKQIPGLTEKQSERLRSVLRWKY